MDKEGVVYIQQNSAMKKDKIMAFAAKWMDPEIIILSEINQNKKDKYHMITLTCGI